jgi:hypothetical protein
MEKSVVHITLSGHGTYSENGDKTAIPDGVNVAMYNKTDTSMAFCDANRLWSELIHFPYHVNCFTQLSDGSFPVLQIFSAKDKDGPPLEKLWIDKDYSQGNGVPNPWWGVWINESQEKVYEAEFPDGGRSLEDWLNILNSPQGRQKLGVNSGDELAVHVICCREQVVSSHEITYKHQIVFKHDASKSHPPLASLSLCICLLLTLTIINLSMELKFMISTTCMSQ